MSEQTKLQVYLTHAEASNNYCCGLKMQPEARYQ